MADLERWLSAFACTQIIEVPIYTWALTRRALRLPTRIGLAFAASALTHPIVWFVMPVIWRLVRTALPLEGSPVVRAILYYALLETVAVLGEYYYLRLLGVARALRWSLLANGASFSIGLLLF